MVQSPILTSKDTQDQHVINKSNTFKSNISCSFSKIEQLPRIKLENLQNNITKLNVELHHNISDTIPQNKNNLLLDKEIDLTTGDYKMKQQIEDENDQEEDEDEEYDNHHSNYQNDYENLVPLSQCKLYTTPAASIPIPSPKQSLLSHLPIKENDTIDDIFVFEKGIDEEKAQENTVDEAENIDDEEEEQNFDNQEEGENYESEGEQELKEEFENENNNDEDELKRPLPSNNDDDVFQFVADSAGETKDNNQEELESLDDDEEEDEEVSFELQEEEVKTPFWFSNEEPAHIKQIIELYASKLNISLERKRFSRAPMSFVGRIKRNKVRGGNQFTSLDEVQIYQRDMLPIPTAVMKLVETVYFITSWESEDGVPINFCKINTARYKSFWQERVVKDAVISYLYCMPVFESETQYEYEVTQFEHDVSYSKSDELSALYEHHIHGQWCRCSKFSHENHDLSTSPPF